jgi:hypothetical protein
MCKEEKGVALVTALLILLALSIIGATAINTAVTDTKISGNVKDTKEALFIAEGGLSYAGEYLQQNLDQWDSYTTPQTLINETTLGDGSFNVTIEDGGGVDRRRLLVTATTNTDATKQIEAYVEGTVIPEDPYPGVLGCSGVVLGSNSQTYSYSSSGAPSTGNEGDVGTTTSGSTADLQSQTQIHGDVHAAGKVLTSSTSKVWGDVDANLCIGMSGYSQVVGNATTSGCCSECSGRVQGDINQFVSPDPVPVLDCDPLGVDQLFTDNALPIQTTNDNAELSGSYFDSGTEAYSIGGVSSDTIGTAGQSKQFYFSSFSTNDSASVTIEGDVTIYCSGNFGLNSTSSITLAGGATASLYVSGNFSLSSGTQLNNSGIPADLMIYSDYPSASSLDYKINLGSDANMTAVVYGPKTAANVTSNGELRGQLIAKYVNVQSDADFYYDEDLVDMFSTTTVGGFDLVLKRHIN